MSIIQVRDAFTRAAGERLHLDHMLMNYSEDRRSQFLTAAGSLPSGEAFTAHTAPFLGDTNVIMQRAAQLVEEIVNPEAREHGTVVRIGVAAGAPAQEPQSAEQSKPVAAPQSEPEHKHKAKMAASSHRR